MMKTRIVTAISFAGVLIAGTAAALVNTQVLGGSSSPSPLVVDAASPVATTPAIAAVPTAAPTTSPATPGVDVPAVQAPVVTQAVYAIGESGTVTLDTANGMLTIVDAVPTAGWQVTKSESNDALNAEVMFQSGTTEIEFHANLLFGVVTTSVDTHDLTATDGSVPNSGGKHGGSDDGNEGGGDDD
jgi:hypothetical protein